MCGCVWADGARRACRLAAAAGVRASGCALAETRGGVWTGRWAAAGSSPGRGAAGAGTDGGGRGRAESL